MRSPRDTRPRALALPLRVNSSTGRALKAGPFAVALPEVYDACVVFISAGKYSVWKMIPPLSSTQGECPFSWNFSGSSLPNSDARHCRPFAAVNCRVTCYEAAAPTCQAWSKLFFFKTTLSPSARTCFLSFRHYSPLSLLDPLCVDNVPCAFHVRHGALTALGCQVGSLHAVNTAPLPRVGPVLHFIIGAGQLWETS